MIKNSEIRNQAKKSGVCLWQIAEELKMQDSNFSRLLRHELSATHKENVKRHNQNYWRKKALVAAHQNKEEENGQK